MTVLMGIKHCGKTTLGKAVAEQLDLPFRDLDLIVEEVYSRDRIYTFRDIYRNLGEKTFRDLEVKALDRCDLSKPGILALGGGTIENSTVMENIKDGIVKIFLDVPEGVLFRRIEKNGFPAFLGEKPAENFHSLYLRRRQKYLNAADKVLRLEGQEVMDAVQQLLKAVEG